MNAKKGARKQQIRVTMFDTKESVKTQMNALFKALIWHDRAGVVCVSSLPRNTASIDSRLCLPEETDSRLYDGVEKRSGCDLLKDI